MGGCHLYNLLHPVPGDHISRRVGRRIDKDGLGPRGDGRPYGRRRINKAFILNHLYRNRNSLNIIDKIGITGIVGIRNNDLIPGIHQCGKEQKHGRRGTRGNQNLPRVHCRIISVFVIAADGIPKADIPQTVGITGFLPGEGLHTHPVDTFWHTKIRLPDFHVHHLNPLGLHFVNLF